MKREAEKILFPALMLLIMLCFTGCPKGEYNTEQNGIHFRKIYQSRGGIYRGYMEDRHVIQGFPCEKGWIHFKEDWELLSFQLSEDFIYRNEILPAHTWIHFPYYDAQTGYVCAFPFDYKVQGYLCRGSGGYKGVDTGFYEDGKLRSFFPPEDIVVDGVPCKACLSANVTLYENGRIKSCKLSEDYIFEGKVYKKGKKIRFDIAGNIKDDI